MIGVSKQETLMPLVRISHITGKSPIQIAAMSQGVHRAMVETFNVPTDDYFQIITEHAPTTGLIGPSTFLGISHTADFVFVQITCAEGRTIEQKKSLYAAIAINLERGAAVRTEDVIINLVETERENWSFGNGLASFVPLASST
jgi:4-oxalocrotonate tautomerase